MVLAKPMPPYPHVTALILAGGSGRRLGGRLKAFLTLDGRTYLERVAQVCGRLFAQTIIVANEPLAYLETGLAVVQDLVPNRGAIMGLLTGLTYAPTPWAFVTACDSPLLQEEVAALIVGAIDDRVKAVLARSQDGLHPLLAAYHRDCRRPLERLVAAGEWSFRPLYRQVPIKEIGPPELAAVDPQGLSFLNINTPQDLARLEGVGEA